MNELARRAGPVTEGEGALSTGDSTFVTLSERFRWRFELVEMAPRSEGFAEFFYVDEAGPTAMEGAADELGITLATFSQQVIVAKRKLIAATFENLERQCNAQTG